MTTTNTIKLDITEKSHNYARIYASLIDDEYQRKRAYSEIVALYAFLDVIEKTNFDIQKSMTLFRNPKLNEEYEISDIYVNNRHVDIRVFVEGEGVLIPKIHFEAGIVPDFYAVIKVNQTLTMGELIGFIDTENIQKEDFDKNYYSILLNTLISYEEFLTKVCSEKIYNFEEKEHEQFKKSYLSLTDNELRKEDKEKLLQHIFKCRECRTEFCCFTGFEMVSCNTAKYPDIMNDQTLNIIGSVAVNEGNYEGKEETIDISDKIHNKIVREPKEEIKAPETKSLKEEITPENKEIQPEEKLVDKETKEEIQKNQEKPKKEKEQEIQHSEAEFTKVEEPQKDVTVSDILDELFSLDEGFNDFDGGLDDKTIEEDLQETIISKDEAEVTTISENEEEEKNSVLSSNLTTDTIEPESIEEDDLTETIKKEEVEILSETITEEDIHVKNKEESIYINDEEDSVNDNIENYTIHDFDENEIVEENSSNGELEIIEEDTPDEEQENSPEDYYEEENIKLLNQNGEDEKEELTVLDVQNEQTASVVDETILNKDNTPNLEIKEEKTSDNEIEILPSDTAGNLQKVIVDYDEYGEPIYSYVNNASEEVEEENGTEAIEEEENFETSNEAENENSPEDELNEIKLENGNEDEEIIVGEPEMINPVNDKDNKINVEDEPENLEEIEGNEESEENNTSSENVIAEDEEYDEDDDTNSEMSHDEDVNSEYEDENEDYEEYDNAPVKKVKNPLPAILTLIVLFIIGGGIGGYFLYKNHANNGENFQPQNENNAELELPVKNEQTDEQPIELLPQDNPENIIEIPQNNSENTNKEQNKEEYVPPLTEKDLLKNENKQPITIHEAMANAFTGTSNSLSLKEVQWQCKPQLYANEAFKAYLQQLDDMFKLNIRKNILNATEIPENRTIAVKMAIGNDGNLERVQISDSSQSAQIDDIVLQSINETFEGEKSVIINEGEGKSDFYYLKLVIKL